MCVVNGLYGDFKKKKAIEEKRRQDQIKIDLKRLSEGGKEEKIRQIRIQNNKKAAALNPQPNEAVNASHELGPYNTASAVSKAVAKLKRALPSVPEKKRVIIRKYVRSLNITDQRFIGIVECKPPKQKKGIKSDVIDAIKVFYERDDISRISPNIRDCRKFKDPVTGLKEQKQIRYLMYKLSDAYNLFVQHIEEDNDDEKQLVALSKFSSLRPSHVKLMSSTPLDQALCIYHSNFIMCCKAIHQKIPYFPEYGAELERLLLCEIPRRECWYRQCDVCLNVKDKLTQMMESSGINGQIMAKWIQWKQNDKKNRFEKYIENNTLHLLITYFLNILPAFLKHSYIKRAQATQFQKDSEDVLKSNGKTAMLQIDFAEGFNCEHQDEVYPAHWNPAQV